MKKYLSNNGYFKAVIFFVSCVLSAMTSANMNKPVTELMELLAGEHRTPAYVLRDKYRHPAETLAFFQIEKIK
jgi:predicted methyltransferase